MRGNDRKAMRAIAQVDQMEAQLRDVLERTGTPELSGMIIELVAADHAADNRTELSISKSLWAVISASAIISMGHEITRRATDAQS